MKYKCFITVFTPTYNRAYIIKNLYESLKAQTDFDFEWLIVDDGSTDNTEQLIDEFIKKHNRFQIRYYKKENGGKHTAINKGLELAEGEMFFIVDSDDCLLSNAISKIKEWENGINEKEKFAGVSGNKGYSEEKLVGSTFKGEYVDATSLERNKLNINGDKAEVFYTALLRKYKFPEFKGEKFLTEDVVWSRIANDGYKIRWFNEIIYTCRYRDDGLFVQYNKLLASNPKGFALYVNQKIKFNKNNCFERNKMYNYYYDTVKNNLKIDAAAEYLNIGKLRLRCLCIYYSFKTFIHKLLRKIKRSS